MTLDRRSLLGLIGAGAATPAVAKSANTGKVAFLHGVASGDPGSHSAVFWTRVTPEAGAGGDVAVTLEVARDDAFRDVVRRVSNLKAGAERDFTVKHELDDAVLRPNTEYFYRFIANGVTSPVGDSVASNMNARAQPSALTWNRARPRRAETPSANSVNSLRSLDSLPRSVPVV